MRPAICSTDSPVSRISRSCSVDAASSSVDVLLHLLRRFGHAADRALHLRHQRAQLFDGVVHRVGDCAGDVFGHRGLLRQVAFGHRLQFVHQSQNRRLVGVVDALGLLLLALGFKRCASAAAARCAWSTHEQAQEAERTAAASSAADSSQQQQARRRRSRRRVDRPRLHRFQAFAQRLAVGNDRACASRAETRPCRLPRIAPAWVRVSSYCLISVASRSRVCGSWCRAGAARRCRRAKPSAISRKEFKSLPSRNTASGDTPSMVRNSLALLPMRCVSITSWPTADSSAARRVLLQLQRRHRLGGFQQVGRLAVDGAQRLAHLRQRLLLREHDVRRSSRRGRPAAAAASIVSLHALRRHRARRPRRLAGRARCAPAPRCSPCTSGNACGAADQRLRHRLRQPLRLHQRLTAGSRPASRRVARPAVPDTAATSQARPVRDRSADARMRCCCAAASLPISGKPVPAALGQRRPVAAGRAFR